MYLSGEKGLDATQLKLIALVLMVLDHIYEFFSYSELVPIWFTWLGRLVFPIFMFTMAEGFYYTQDRKKYMLRLYMGTAFMGVINYLLYSTLTRPDNMPIMNNIFSTFFMTVLYLYLIEEIKASRNFGKNIAQPIAVIILSLVATFIPIAINMVNNNINYYIPYGITVLLVSLFPSPMFVEGGPVLIVLGIIMYYTRGNRTKQITIYVILCLMFYTGGGLNLENLLCNNYQWMMVFSAIFMLLYNGEKGRGYKYLFYIFYPTHIYILYVLSVFIMLK